LSLAPFPLGAINLGSREIRRQQIRRELDAVEVALQARGQSLYRFRLCESWGALDQEMPIGEQRDQEPLDKPLLPQDLPFHVAAKPRELFTQRIGIRRFARHEA
jgi:hypothetical protein